MSSYYTPQERETAYTLAQMGSWNQSQGRPFPIQTQPVNAFGRPRTWNASTGQWKRKRRGGTRRSNRRKATRRRNTRRRR